MCPLYPFFLTVPVLSLLLVLIQMCKESNNTIIKLQQQCLNSNIIWSDELKMLCVFAVHSITLTPLHSYVGCPLWLCSVTQSSPWVVTFMPWSLVTPAIPMIWHAPTGMTIPPTTSQESGLVVLTVTTWTVARMKLSKWKHTPSIASYSSSKDLVIATMHAIGLQ